MEGVEVAAALDGRRIQRLDDGWPALEGTVSVVALPDPRTGVGAVRLTFPTEKVDVWDYILRSEGEAGFTSKVQLVSARGPAPVSHRVTRVARLGMPREDGRPAYELDFEIAKGAVNEAPSILFLAARGSIARVDPG
ncbi:hypothetical protein [Nocardioides pyridinolyticus]